MSRHAYVSVRHRLNFFALPPCSYRFLELYWVASLERPEREAYHLTLSRIQVTNVCVLALNAWVYRNAFSISCIHVFSKCFFFSKFLTLFS